MGWEGFFSSKTVLEARDLPAGLSVEVWWLSKPVALVRLLEASCLGIMQQPALWLGLENGEVFKPMFCLQLGGLQIRIQVGRGISACRQVG